MICANIANLLFARVPGRLREAGIRKAMGATESRLVQQMLVENLLLVFAGGFLGMLLAYFGVRWLVRFGLADIPRLNEVRVDAGTLVFAITASGMTAALFGALPAWLVSRVNLNETLGSGGKSVTENGRTRKLRTSMVATEVAMCTVLLITAVLLREAFYGRTLEGIRNLPGVRSAAWVSILPLEGEGSVSSINLPGHQLSEQDEPMANYRVVSPDYFQTMGIPVLTGRAFNNDDRGKRQVIVSESLAHRLWPNQNATGKQCLAEWGPLQLSEVIGVAGDIPTSLDQPPLYIVYVADSWGEVPPSAPGSASIVVRSVQDSASIANAVRNAIHQAGPDVPIVALRPMSQLVALNLEGRRFQMSLTSSFAVSALLLASLGIFGVLAYSVEQRRREFAIRAALGAQPSHLLVMVMRQGLWPVALGLGVGTVVALLSSSLLHSLIFGITPLDPVTFAAVALTIMIVAVVACYIPARHAMITDPAVALRYE
jgi:hypothetical protein